MLKNSYFLPKIQVFCHFFSSKPSFLLSVPWSCPPPWSHIFTPHSVTIFVPPLPAIFSVPTYVYKCKICRSSRARAVILTGQEWKGESGKIVRSSASVLLRFRFPPLVVAEYTSHLLFQAAHSTETAGETVVPAQVIIETPRKVYQGKGVTTDN